MSWWPRPPTPPMAVVDPSPMTATFTASLGLPDRGPAPSISLGIPIARPAAIEPLRKLRRAIGFISMLTMDLGCFGVNGRSRGPGPTDPPRPWPVAPYV